MGAGAIRLAGFQIEVQMIFFFLGGMAQAGLDDQTLQEMVEELRPAVEREASRRFLHLPEARITTRSEVVPLAIQYAQDQLVQAGMAPAEAASLADQRVHQVTDSALALYLMKDQRLYLLTEELGTTSKKTTTPSIAI